LEVNISAKHIDFIDVFKHAH